MMTAHTDLTVTAATAGSPQLTLGIALREVASFTNFVGGCNREALETLQQAVANGEPAAFYLWGESGAGASHLLQAICRAFTQRSEPAAYLPLTQLRGVPAAALTGMEQLAAVCIDDIDVICGDATWEEAIFHLFNRVRDAGGMLVIAGHAPPAHVGLRLADLRSRLGAMIGFHLHALDDDSKMHAMQLRARHRGMELPDDVAAFLLRHYRRDTKSLFALLDRLDETSLIAQRRLTIPFVKTVIDD